MQVLHVIHGRETEFFWTGPQNQSAVQVTYLFLQLSKLSSSRWQKVANVTIVFSFLTKSHGSPHSGISSMNKHHDLEIKKTNICLATRGRFNIIHLIPDLMLMAEHIATYFAPRSHTYILTCENLLHIWKKYISF